MMFFIGLQNGVFNFCRRLFNHTLFTCLSVCCLGCSFSSSAASPYNITDYGAKGDGTTMNTSFINKAISACNHAGGGTVVVPAGNYMSGTIILLSNVNLYFEAGAVITGSRDTSDYLQIDRALFTEGYNRFGLFYAEDAMNISVSGFGELNGNGSYFMNDLDKPQMRHDFNRKFTRQGDAFMKVGTVFEDGPVSYAFRPGLMMTISHCENVEIKDVLIKDSPEWTIRIADCDEVHINGITYQKQSPYSK